MHAPFRSRRLVVVIAVALLLSGCSAGTQATPDDTPDSASPTAPVSPSPSAVVDPDGSADDNLAVFAHVMDQVAASEDAVSGRAYIDALADVGFDKTAMQVTQDRTTVDNPAESIQFSVLWNGECLVGQVGPSTPAPTALVLPELPDGGCLIGQTRQIDW